MTDTLTLSHASSIVEESLRLARENNMNPLTVVVLDAGGHLKAMQREDGCGILRFDVAYGKAYGSLGMGVPSRLLGVLLADRPSFLNALAATADGRLIPVPGGVLIKNAAGAVIGAVGVTGDTSDKDEYCAIGGIKTVGLEAMPPEPVPDWAGSKP